MTRPLGKGSISLGLVTVPIGLVSAIEARRDYSARRDVTEAKRHDVAA